MSKSVHNEIRMRLTNESNLNKSSTVCGPPYTGGPGQTAEGEGEVLSKPNICIINSMVSSAIWD